VDDFKTQAHAGGGALSATPAQAGTPAHGGRRAHLISARNRATLMAVGLISWAAGGVATFLSGNGAGAAALIAVGAGCGVLALMGRWPSRIALSGNELSWDAVRETVDSQIQVAQGSGEADSALAELEELRERLVVLQRTGSVPEHPAEIYDGAVEEAMRRLFPRAEVIRQGIHSPGVADFLVACDGGQAFVETKWRSDVARPFGGSTLPPLIERLPPGAKLLVVMNALDPPSAAANKIVEDALGDGGRIVRWRDVRDDGALGAALGSLLAEAGRSQ
jgi:hypothetical protein